jgi:hypothetical protein
MGTTANYPEGIHGENITTMHFLITKPTANTLSRAKSAYVAPQKFCSFAKATFCQATFHTITHTRYRTFIKQQAMCRRIIMMFVLKHVELIIIKKKNLLMKFQESL